MVWRRGSESRLRLPVKASVALVAVGLALIAAGCGGDDKDDGWFMWGNNAVANDIANISTRAERRGDGWVLRGGKTWVTNAPVADVLTVAAKTTGARGLRNVALFLLDRILGMVKSEDPKLVNHLYLPAQHGDLMS